MSIITRDSQTQSLHHIHAKQNRKGKRSQPYLNNHPHSFQQSNPTIFLLTGIGAIISLIPNVVKIIEKEGWELYLHNVFLIFWLSILIHFCLNPQAIVTCEITQASTKEHTKEYDSSSDLESESEHSSISGEEEDTVFPEDTECKDTIIESPSVDDDEDSTESSDSELLEDVKPPENFQENIPSSSSEEDSAEPKGNAGAFVEDHACKTAV